VFPRAKRNVQHADAKPRIALASLAIASVAFAAPATASTPEDTYLAALARHGITGDPQASDLASSGKRPPRQQSLISRHKFAAWRTSAHSHLRG
jgi:hypothetical protein